MDTNFLTTGRKIIKHWYISLIVGLLFLCIGIYSLASPMSSYVALTMLFSLSFLVSGFSEIIFSVSNRDQLDNWGWHLAYGIFTFIIGMLLVANPAISIVTLPLYVGILVMVRSIMGVSLALELKRNEILAWKDLMTLSVLGVLFSLLLLWSPSFAGMTMVFWLGVALITSGLFSIYLAFKFRKMNKIKGSISEDLKARYQKVKKELEASIRAHGGHEPSMDH